MPPSFRNTSVLTAGGRKAFSCSHESGQEPLRTKKTARVLVVDDERIVVKVISRILGRGGHEATTAENGKEGLDIFKAGGIDLVISDFHMPGGNGLEMLKEIKKLDPDAKVIMMSGDATEAERAEMLAAGALRVFSKPFEVSEMVSAIKEALE